MFGGFLVFGEATGTLGNHWELNFEGCFFVLESDFTAKERTS